MNLADAYEPHAFEATGRAVVGALGEYLQAVQERALPVLAPVDPAHLLQRWDAPLGDAAGEGIEATFVELVREVLAHSTHAHHPRYVGHQVAGIVAAT